MIIIIVYEIQTNSNNYLSNYPAVERCEAVDIYLAVWQYRQNDAWFSLPVIYSLAA